MAKHVLGNSIILEEVHRQWGLLFRTTWAPSTAYGWVRTSELVNIGQHDIACEVLDGLVDVMPPNIPELTEQKASNLANAYKRTEIGSWGRAALFTTESLITDRAEPGESLSASIVWSGGHAFAHYYIDERAVHDMCDTHEMPRTQDARVKYEHGTESVLDAMNTQGMLDIQNTNSVAGTRGAADAQDTNNVAGTRDAADAQEAPDVFESDSLVVGRAGAYLVRDSMIVEVQQSIKWTIVADIGLDYSSVRSRIEALSHPEALAHISADIASSSAHLRRLLKSADGLQKSGEPIADMHHLSNVLFNSMRGGLFPYEYRIPVGDLIQFISQRNRNVHARYLSILNNLGGEMSLDRVHTLVRNTNDPDFMRLLLEYIPLSFSRRHGDPSRPWNIFSIRVKNDVGEEMLSYEGNWRDIFQNWEALLYSFPAYIPHMVAKFVNATTADGYNSFKIGRDGVEWETPDPSNPWSNIGYWGDHQIIYLLRLLEAWQRFYPHGIVQWLDCAVFVYTDLPYILASYTDMVRDPRNTVSYDEAAAARIMERMERIGGDGSVVHSSGVVHVGLMEKLLVPALAKIVSLVPYGGIWMNTQRPEWNDANNALAGFGVSMVTLYYLRRYMEFLRTLLVTSALSTVHLSRVVSDWMVAITKVLEHFEYLRDPQLATSKEKRAFMDAMGKVATEHRVRIQAVLMLPQ